MRMSFTILHLYCSEQLSISNMEKRYRNKIIVIIILIINLIYIVQFDTNGILTALYMVTTYIQMQYVHV